MLGKGLESLIPQKGDGQGNPPSGPIPPIQTELSGEPRQVFMPAQGSAPAPLPAPAVREVGVMRPETPFQPAPQTMRAQAAPSLPGKERPSLTEESNEAIFRIEIDKIEPNPDQPRRHFDEASLRDLAHSIREFGFLQPLVVSKVEKESANGISVSYQLIAGERRLMAAKLLGLHSVPAIVRNINLEREKLELAVIENIQREGLNPIETARAFQRLQEEFRMTQREIAAKLGKSREVVANTVRLLDLPEFARVAVEKGELTESNARLLLAVQDPGAQQRLFEDILHNHLTTRDVKDRLRRAGGPRRGRPPKSEENLPPEIKAMEQSLSMDLGAPVEIHKGQNTGKITITFYSEEELENILRKLGKG